MARRNPPAGINLFQLAYILAREYEARTGLPPLNLSLGNPDTVPDPEILGLQAACASDPRLDYHTYAEENDIEGFVEAMVEVHSGLKVRQHPHLRAIPIPGIKTAVAFAPLACGLHQGDAARRAGFSIVSNLPAYDVIGTWGRDYLGARRVAWPLVAEEGMRLNMGRLREALSRAGVRRPDLVLVIRPGNPSSVGATEGEWRELIAFCVENGSRLVNDGAYCGLAGPGAHVPLASVAKDTPELEWAEMYSVSKSFSDPGARLGAMVGSRDFIEDFVIIKGNSESGPVPSVMAAYGRFLRRDGAARRVLAGLRDLYRRRVDYVSARFREAGLLEACRVEAGFFTLWKAPKSVLGTGLGGEFPPHEAYNRRVISETGIVGVHFMGSAAGGGPEPLIRYAVCADVLAPAFQARFEDQLSRLKPVY
jgi:aspartate/methionine/tyrosine aminotransferase